MIGLADYLGRRYSRVAEIGIGSYDKVAVMLVQRGIEVIAIDIDPRPLSIPVHRDDVWHPDPDRYNGVEALYSIRPPPELVPPIKRLAQRLNVDLVIKPLSAEPTDGILINEAGCFFYLVRAGV